MPLFELQHCGEVTEKYLQHWDDPNPDCPICGKPMERLVSRFSPVWCRSMDCYNDKSKEYASVDGHFGWRKNGERVWIDSRKKQKDFVRSEGLVDPIDLPTNAKMNAAGTKLVTQSGNLSEI